MKTRPWKFVDLARKAPWLPGLFKRVIWRQKPSSIAQGYRVFKNVSYDKIKFTFLDIVKNQPFDLM